jgi:hypothetical protein
MVCCNAEHLANPFHIRAILGKSSDSADVLSRDLSSSRRLKPATQRDACVIVQSYCLLERRDSSGFCEVTQLDRMDPAFFGERSRGQIRAVIQILLSQSRAFIGGVRH